MAWPTSIAELDQLGAAPAGASLAIALPSWSPSTHSPTSLQETAFSCVGASTAVSDHVGVPEAASALA